MLDKKRIKIDIVCQLTCALSQNILLAATAVTHSLTRVTRNLRDFQYPDLKSH